MRNVSAEEYEVLVNNLLIEPLLGEEKEEVEEEEEEEEKEVEEERRTWQAQCHHGDG